MRLALRPLCRVATPRALTRPLYRVVAPHAVRFVSSFPSACATIQPPTDKPLFDYLRERGDWSGCGDKTALIEAYTGNSVRYSELEARVHGVAHALHALGFRQGDVLSLHLHNCIEFILAFMATATLGGTVTTSNPAYTAHELAMQLNDSGAKVVLSGHAYREVVSQATASLSGPPLLAVSYIEESGCFAHAPPREDPVALTKALRPTEDVLVLPYSSGTTGRPKGVMLSHYNVLANVAQLNDPSCAAARFPFGADDVLVGLLPLYHIYGMTVLMCTALATQSQLVLLPKFEPETFVRTIEKYKVSMACVAPPVCLFLAKHPVVDTADLSSLKFIYSGAAPLDALQEKAVVNRLGGGVRVRQAWGMTELSPVALVAGADVDVPGSAGRVGPNTEVKIVDPITGEDLGVDAEGELCVRGPQVMLGYLNRPEATAETMRPDGFLRSGDLARIDADGNVFVGDRLKELIKVKGFQVSPAEVEGALLENDAVEDCCVIGVADERSGQVPKAFVKLRAGSEAVDAEALLESVRPRLAKYKWPQHVEMVDAIPKSPSGKILRRVLRDANR